MKSRSHHNSNPSADTTPEPERGLDRWKAEVAGWLGKDPDERWGAQLLRIASDMMIVCGEDLEILHHNRAFLKAVGYHEGSFRRQRLDEFFPAGERQGVFAAFQDWRRGHAAGMRFQASLLTTKGLRPCDFRAVRSRDRDGGYVYYLVARDTPERARTLSQLEESSPEPFFRGLPVAAWRTDADLRILHAYGSLWPELGVASEDLVGEVFGRRHDTLLPSVLLLVDCSDTLAGMSLQTEVSRENEIYNVTVEPFLDAAGRVVGTVGMVRRAATPIQTGATHRGGERGGRHHAPPAASSGISIVTGRVPKFGDDPEETVLSQLAGAPPLAPASRPGPRA